MHDLDDVNQTIELMRLETPGIVIKRDYIVKRLMTGSPVGHLIDGADAQYRPLFDTTRASKQRELSDWAHGGSSEGTSLYRLSLCIQYINRTFLTNEARSRAFDVLADLVCDDDVPAKLRSRRVTDDGTVSTERRERRPKVSDLLNRAAAAAGEQGASQERLYVALVSGGHICKRPDSAIKMWLKRGLEQGKLKVVNGGNVVWLGTMIPTTI